MERQRYGSIRAQLALIVLATALALAACTAGDDSVGSMANGAESTVVSEFEGTESKSAESESAVASDYLGSYTIEDEGFGTSVSVTVNNGIRSIETNSLPNHETGAFPNSGNPNTISAQDLSYEFPVEPTFVGNATFAQTPGVAVNGIAFEPATAESVNCDSGEQYRIEALQEIYDLGFDVNNAHVQPTGQYHYHGVSELLIGAYATDEDLVHVGFAADGFLIYFSKSNAYEPSFQLDSQARSGTECVASGPGAKSVDIDGSDPDGTYTSDWSYVDGSGDLDSCNGTTIDGTYAYLVTTEYPFVGRCLNGEYTETRRPPDAQQQGGQPSGDEAGQGQSGQGQNGQRPDLAVAAATLGISEQDLQDALGSPPPDIDAAAAELGVTPIELEDALDAGRV